MQKPLLNKRTKQRVYTIRVTDILYSLETIDDTGLPPDSIWKAERLYYGLRIKGRRTDQTNVPPINVLFPITFGGAVATVRIGDLVQVLDDPAIPTPIALGVVYSQSTTWTSAVKNYERPLPPQLESPGSTGTLYNYNAIYGTYIPTYTPTDETAGIWYDRFIKFPVGYFVKDKRSLPSYNNWFATAFKEKKEGISDIILNILENWSCLYRQEKFFYLNRNLMPFRPDPVFDTTSQTHQSSAPEPVIKSKHGVGFFDGRADKSWTDKFPAPLTLQNVPDSAKKTAYDEIINASLEELRRNSGNYDNAELPLDPRVIQEIKIGRNKLIISDVYGDGTNVFITLKNEHDAGISIVYTEFTDCTEVKKDCQTYREGSAEYAVDMHPGEGTQTITNTYDTADASCDGKKISQVRIRGPLGESLLLESYGTSEADSYSRIVARGIGGQLFELYDDLESGSNYIYGLSSTPEDTSDTWSLNRGSFFLAATNELPPFLRLNNNSILSVLPAFDQLVIQGAFSPAKQSYAAQYTTPSSAILHEYVSSGKPYERKVVSTADDITETIDYNTSSISVLSTTDGSNSLYKIAVNGSQYIEVANTGITIDAGDKPVIIKGAGITLNSTTGTVEAVNNTAPSATGLYVLRSDGTPSSVLKAGKQ